MTFNPFERRLSGTLNIITISSATTCLQKNLYKQKWYGGFENCGYFECPGCSEVEITVARYHSLSEIYFGWVVFFLSWLLVFLLDMSHTSTKTSLQGVAP